MVEKESIIEALKDCYDPEIPINIVDLGLIYDIKIDDGDVYIKMTLTAPGCPMHSLITEQVKQAIERIEGVKKVFVEVVWDPPWSPERMSIEAKKLLGVK
ncbi:MAG: iron-sulfur cluster assembly protein [Candidatus Bathyarchaeia archaeon]